MTTFIQAPKDKPVGLQMEDFLMEQSSISIGAKENEAESLKLIEEIT